MHTLRASSIIVLASLACCSEAPAPKPPTEEGKAVAPTGMRIAGFAIQAVKDGKVIAENVQDQSIKALIGSEGTKPGPLFSIDRPEKAEN